MHAPQTMVDTCSRFERVLVHFSGSFPSISLQLHAMDPVPVFLHVQNASPEQSSLSLPPSLALATLPRIAAQDTPTPAHVLAAEIGERISKLDLNPQRLRVAHATGKIFKKPKQIYCHLCGREFGTKSLNIHVRTCKSKFIRSASAVAAPDPPDPSEFPRPGFHDSDSTFLKYNLEALRIFGELTNDYSLYEKLRVEHDEEEQRRAAEAEEVWSAAQALLVSSLLIVPSDLLGSTSARGRSRALPSSS